MEGSPEGCDERDVWRDRFLGLRKEMEDHCLQLKLAMKEAGDREKREALNLELLLIRKRLDRFPVDPSEKAKRRFVELPPSDWTDDGTGMSPSRYVPIPVSGRDIKRMINGETIKTFMPYEPPEGWRIFTGAGSLTEVEVSIIKGGESQVLPWPTIEGDIHTVNIHGVGFEFVVVDIVFSELPSPGWEILCKKFVEPSEKDPKE